MRARSSSAAGVCSARRCSRASATTRSPSPCRRSPASVADEDYGALRHRRPDALPAARRGRRQGHLRLRARHRRSLAWQHDRALLGGRADVHRADAAAARRHPRHRLRLYRRLVADLGVPGSRRATRSSPATRRCWRSAISPRSCRASTSSPTSSTSGTRAGTSPIDDEGTTVVPNAAVLGLRTTINY